MTVSIMPRSFVIPLVLLMLASPSWAGKPADEDIRKALLGSWIVPRDSSDYDGTYSREVFRADGTYVLIVYRDRACKIVVEETPVKWSVDHGVLTSIAPGGVVIRDEVLSIDARRMTLHSLDDGTTYTREKSEACADSPA